MSTEEANGEINPFTAETVGMSDLLSWLSANKRRFGITRVADVTGLDRLGVPVALAIRPNARSVTVSQGKGRSIDEARVAAIMEAVELWHAETVAGPLWYGSHRDLAQRFRMPPSEWLARSSLGRWRADLPMPWMKARDVLGDGEMLVPFALVHMDMTAQAQPVDGDFSQSSNGLASGRTRAGALQHALCELIERDGLTVWHHRPQPERASTRIDPATLPSIEGSPLGSSIESGVVKMAAFDCTTDIGVPTILCVLVDELGHLGLGSAAHPHARIAFERALFEAAQTRMTYITGSRDDLGSAEFERDGRSEKLSFGRALLELGDGARVMQDIPTIIDDDRGAALAWVVERLKAAGMHDVLFVDLAREEWRIPVVRAIVPGLERPHDEGDFAPGARARAAAGER